MTLYTTTQIQTRIKGLAKQIAFDYQEKELHLVSILKGSFFVAAYLIRAMYEAGKTDVDVDFLQISSYAKTKQSSKTQFSNMTSLLIFQKKYS